MLEESLIVLEPTSAYPLSITAKQYCYHIPNKVDSHTQDPDTITLILLHGTSFHKETWEPTLMHIFDLAAKRNPNAGGVDIREAWAIECPNHGGSALLNEMALREGQDYHCSFSCENYAYAVHRFLSGRLVDFGGRKLVGIGHSLGGVAMTILQHIEPLIRFSSIILVEPMLSSHGAEAVADLRKALVKGAYERRDVWPSKVHALKDLRSRPHMARWNPHALELFVEHALIPHKGARFEPPYTGVTLACTRDEEAAMYRDADGSTKPIPDLNRACASMPVHIIFGNINDRLPRSVHDALVDPQSGRQFASVTRIKGSGHLVPQHAPKALGKVIFSLLRHQARRMPSSRL